MQEEWKDITGYEGIYQVSNWGNIKSFDRIANNKYGSYLIKGKILKYSIDKDGYHRVYLTKNKQTKTFLKHRLVAIAFIPNPNNLPEINHKDENPSNPKVDNLEWCNRKYNINYGNRTKKSASKKSNPVYQYSTDGYFIKKWDSAKQTSKYGFNSSHIGYCCKNEKNFKTHKNYKWSYIPPLNNQVQF